MPIELGKGGVALDGSDTATILKNIVYQEARSRAAALSDLTDNSGGTSGSGTVAAITDVTAFTVTGTDLAPKAGFDTALGAIKNALKTLTTNLNAACANVGVTQMVYNGGGSDGSGTIAAVTTNLTAVNGGSSGGLAYAGTNAIIAEYENAVATIAAKVNQLRKAVNLTPITDNSGGTPDTSTYTVAALTATTGAGVDGTSDSGVEETDGEAALDSIVDAIATLAEATNDVTSVSGNPLVVCVD